MDIYPVKGGYDKSLQDVDAHRVAEELVCMFAVFGPCNLMIRKSLKSCGFWCCDSPASGPKPVALSFGECKCWCFGTRSWVFQEGFREMFVYGPVAFCVFDSGSRMRFIDESGRRK